MYPTARTEYISLDLGLGPPAFISSKPTSRSLWRQWNQLSRFQRNILYFSVITFIILIVYLMPGKSQTHAGIDEIDYDSAKNDAQLPKGADELLENIKKIEEEKQLDDTQALLKSIRERLIQKHEEVDKAEKYKEKNEIAENNEKSKNADNQQQVEVIEGPEFQPEANQIDGNQIHEPPKHKIEPLKFDGPQNDRQRAVVAAFKHSWTGYKKFAWGKDNVKPISKGFHEWFGLGLSIVDALDTMYMMGLNEEFDEARNWVKDSLNFKQNRDVNLFEVTIRVLGGLLSAYHLSGDTMFLNKAIDLGDRMLPAFNTPSGVPYSDVNLGARSAHPPKWGPDSSTSEITSIQLEFRDLSRSSGMSRFEDSASKVSEHVHRLEKYDGLVPIFINANTGMFREYAVITMGARGDSYYEYLLKQWIQTGKRLTYLKDDYLQGIAGTEKHLIKKTAVNKYWFTAELLGTTRDLKPKMDHLTCYLSGTLALGVHNGLPKDHLTLADELLKTCYQTYLIHPTGLAAELTYFNMQKTDDANHRDMYVRTNDAHNLLRPEFIESLYYMYYFTGNKTYQDWGWRIFQSFENYTKVEHGYTSISNVKNIHNTRPRDLTESFWFAETLKYLYLLFDDSRQLISLDKWVFNSEGHPLPIYES
ncbi:endoplasmic reticulum mannosyl-oligosaccharide 1,2-alpha-mannosidase [Trichogramma pretiosum]|uniref:endoplasmic reticulum mannosyl-oligosaccharide 1,2-alpha-mannosidase n=1 Tax=Trichogramma pretiosum TaxID=7493 RepID=UPI0006C976B3|nr:endoplasmic reticulum mannosyl-oligosaccharide 1,2-alpha-mannosidase [Trichogramma pretiosum]